MNAATDILARFVGAYLGLDAARFAASLVQSGWKSDDDQGVEGDDVAAEIPV